MRFLPLLVLMFLPAVAALAGPPETWPTKGWPVSTPEAQGLDGAFSGRSTVSSPPESTATSTACWSSGTAPSSSRSPIRTTTTGCSWARVRPASTTTTTPRGTPTGSAASCTRCSRSRRASLPRSCGIAMRRGEIPAVDAKVMPYFSAFQTKPDPRRDAMTLRDVLTMTTGSSGTSRRRAYTNAKNNCAEMEATDGLDPVRPRSAHGRASPAKQFVYNSGATELLSYLIKKATGKEADDYAKEHLFGPLGIEYAWKRTPKGLADTEGGLYLRPRDLAKFGLLYPEGRGVGGEADLARGMGQGLDRLARRHRQRAARLRLQVVGAVAQGPGDLRRLRGPRATAGSGSSWCPSST